MKKAKLKLYFSRNSRLDFTWYPIFRYYKLRWKDKYETPRCEKEPYFKFEWLWFDIYGIWGDDQYWEQWLWIYKYHNGNIEKAKKEWEWEDSETKQSTWIDY